MKYFFRKGQPEKKKLLLLHGTGGDEHSLLSIADRLDSEATILSFRGEVKENGMNRFFKRTGLNQFDYESLEQESERLYQSIRKISQEKKIGLDEWVIVGYSNGANIAAHILLEKETELCRALLFHPMSLGVHTQKFSLSKKEIWLSASANDPIVSREDSEYLVTEFRKRGGHVEVLETKTGHQIDLDEIDQAKAWLDK